MSPRTNGFTQELGYFLRAERRGTSQIDAKEARNRYEENSVERGFQKDQASLGQELVEE